MMNKIESEVYNFLCEYFSIVEYEKPLLVIDCRGKMRIWYPDFYIPEINKFIEVTGFEKNSDDDKMQTYADLKLNPIWIRRQELGNRWKNYLMNALINTCEQKIQINNRSLLRLKKHKI